MAKNKKKNKNSKPNAQQVKEVQVEETAVEENVEVIEPDKVEDKAEEKTSKAEKEDKKAKNDKKQKKEKKSLGTKIKEVYSELKKVSWPKFSNVVKSTGVVIFVVLVCMLLLFGIDMAFKYGIYDQIIG